MKKLVVLILMQLVIGGCASMSNETKTEETLWQAANAADAYSTDRIVNHSNGVLQETGQWKYINGGHPSTAEVIEDAAVWGTAHFVATDLLAEHDAPKWLQRAWQFVSFTRTGIIVSNNFKLIHHEELRQQSQGGHNE